MSFDHKSGRTVFETVIILSLLGILLVVAINRFLKHERAAKETILHGELANIRTSIRLYEVINGKFPESLEELTKGEYLQAYDEDTVIKGKYLKMKAVDESGVPLDPFGNKYGYDKKTGKIKCLTRGYEGW
jgi:general secretion pathway protein G